MFKHAHIHNTHAHKKTHKYLPHLFNIYIFHIYNYILLNNYQQMSLSLSKSKKECTIHILLLLLIIITKHAFLSKLYLQVKTIESIIQPPCIFLWFFFQQIKIHFFHMQYITSYIMLDTLPFMISGCFIIFFLMGFIFSQCLSVCYRHSAWMSEVWQKKIEPYFSFYNSEAFDSV